MAISKVEFELDMIKLFGLPKGVIWFTLHCAYDKTPMITCEYEVQSGENLKVLEDGTIETIKKKYNIVLEEIEKEK